MTEKDKGRSLFVQRGVRSSHDGRGHGKQRRFVKKKRTISVEPMYKALLKQSRIELAKAITLIESARMNDRAKAQKLMEHVLPYTGESVRLGISGVPGAGKSTFIETFGMMLCELGFRVAVLAIDPSSTLSGGSILGDKTRMQRLASHPNAFIRPSPSSGTLGGVHRKTRETMLLCEAAGYDVVIIETVGTGQNETTVRNMVDFFTLLVLTGAGDELQGMKKGIMEMADLLIVHKADGDNVKFAKRTVQEYKKILHFLQPATEGWETAALPVSSLENRGHEEVWETITKFKQTTETSSVWQQRRKEQMKIWFHEMIQDRLYTTFFKDEGKKRRMDELEQQIIAEKLPVSSAVDQLFLEEK